MKKTFYYVGDVKEFLTLSEMAQCFSWKTNTIASKSEQNAKEPQAVLPGFAQVQCQILE